LESDSDAHSWTICTVRWSSRWGAEWNMFRKQQRKQYNCTSMSFQQCKWAFGCSERACCSYLWQSWSIFLKGSAMAIFSYLTKI